MDLQHCLERNRDRALLPAKRENGGNSLIADGQLIVEALKHDDDFCGVLLEQIVAKNEQWVTSGDAQIVGYGLVGEPRFGRQPIEELLQELLLAPERRIA